ncbi:Rv0909 family putative TA system antitoxin [Kutzneria sp. NPDC052558]|uniref:Rv0909 family putative TA system antitoxin n=1 Tax=Kutzneria sp. NPDC052558 TaxID=3364121 RepID=UPI0037C7F38A
MTSFFDKAKEMANDLAEKAAPLRDKAAEVAGDLAEKAEPLREKAAPYLEQAGEAINKGADAAAAKMDELTGGKFSEGVRAVGDKVTDLFTNDKK